MFFIVGIRVVRLRDHAAGQAVRCLTFLLVAGLIWLGFSHTVVAKERYFYRAAESTIDTRYEYERDLLKLALEKTRAEYGDFELSTSPVMNVARAIAYARGNPKINFVFAKSYTSELGATLGFVRFPIDLGILSYRVCFHSSAIADAVGDIKDLKTLKQYSIGQGTGWQDVGILRHNGFTVMEHSNYEGLFYMVAARRFDLFCRGANEVLTEYNSHRDISDFSLNESFALVYPFPRFFFMNLSNTRAAERLQKGLEAAYNDGSLQALWSARFQESIDYVNLKERRLFHLDNPVLKDLDDSYQQYFYDPLNQ